MKVMLDTNICIAIIKQKPPHTIKRFNDYKVGEIGISWVTLAELEFGVAKNQYQEKNQAALDEFVLPLENKGTPIGSLVMMIGAHALSLGVTLATNNSREFSRIKGLTVVDWLASGN